MQDPKMSLADEFSTPKLKKKKPSTKKRPLFLQQGNDANGASPPPVKAGQKGTKRNMKNEVSPSFQQQPERLSSDSLPDSSPSGSGYRALRLKYLLLEEESFALGSDLRAVEDEVKTLEDEKNALLDKLVVLEGLVDPSELHLS
ncbi:uncharacterized protein LOC103950203 isoform X1 [Pyrus x bretschneideri]|uniref:uncharacterized protein LOC103950203 isoform X1 n=2 Tax=Pyrus x bretschneideri TaxID=225117 RepID=UPI0005111C63|nr:uncharacterized protein LOC103950203 isoform X1 [Pyrus x bretschneideri]XP_009359653.1 uncharacterized protein LOC103950203 isoform X1 [Pyrus x bretschneideri]XP_009359654.1 uncharacterized protein LOC103950203 isoform X1 [Pyrus x bretschneideri]XP_009359655.1 uncharacterized protein LOC103950203 isoform X1 [Pyrus x bretschneideri]